MKSCTLISLLCAIVGWALAVFLAMQLLSGPFGNSTCQTLCRQAVFGISFAIAMIGLIFSISGISTDKSKGLKLLSLFALISLNGIYMTTTLIGNFDLL